MNTDTTFVWHNKIKDIEENICIWKYNLMEKGACTVWCIYTGIVFAEISSLAAITWLFSDEDNNLDQKYKSKYFWIFTLKISNFKSEWRKCIYKIIQHFTTRNPWIIMIWNWNPHKKDPKILALQIFGIKCCLYPKKSKTTSPQKLLPSDCITL